MSKQTRGLSPLYSFLPAEIEGFDELAELALDMRWSWNHYADELWRQFDAKLWGDHPKPMGHPADCFAGPNTTHVG